MDVIVAVLRVEGGRAGSPREAEAAGDEAALDVVGAATDDVHDRQAQAVLELPAARHARDVPGERGHRAEDLQGGLAEVLGELAAQDPGHRRLEPRASP